MSKENSIGTDLIKVEAVNIYATLSQSDNLSVYRGASLTLREVMFALLDKFKGSEFNLTALSLGASVGLYHCTDAVNAQKSITKFLNDEYLGYTFVISTAINYTDFNQAKEALIQQGRIAQLRQTGISFSNATSSNAGVCELSGLLVANTSETIKGATTQLNSVLKKRFNFGKKSKQAFYKRELKALKEKAAFVEDLNFTNSIEDIANRTIDNRLENKVAYVYIDGNKFSKIQQTTVNSGNEQLKFDLCLQAYRADFLYKLLQWAKTDEHFQTDEGTIRLETLLWGGDECLFVMPATVGFAFVHQFFDWSKDWQYQGYPLTHSLGLVFCQQATPVGRMRSLAQTLADDCKEKMVEYDKNQNANDHSCNKTDILGLKNGFDFMVLESIDYPASSLNAHYDVCYADLAPIKKQHLSLIRPTTPGAALTALAQISQPLKAIGKSQVYQLAKAAFAPGNFDSLVQNSQRPLAIQEARLKAVCELSNDALATFVNNASTVLLGKTLSLDHDADLQTRALLWVFITQAWEYLMVETCGATQ